MSLNHTSVTLDLDLPALLKKWGVPENYVGVGHCILGYAKGEARPPKERKADYVVRV